MTWRNFDVRNDAVAPLMVRITCHCNNGYFFFISFFVFFSKVFVGLEFRCEFQAGFTSRRSRKSEVSLFSHCQKWQWCLTWTETSGSMFGHIFPAARRCHRRHRGQAVKVSDKDQCRVSHCVSDEREGENENIIFFLQRFFYPFVSSLDY